MKPRRATSAEKKKARRELAVAKINLVRATQAMLSATANHVEKATALVHAVKERQRWQSGVLRRGLRLIRWAGESVQSAVRGGDHAAAEEAKEMLLAFSNKLTEFVKDMSPLPQKSKKGARR